MWIVGLLVLIALGLLGVASWLSARRPEMSGPLKQLQGIEGWVGVVGLVWGVIALLQWLQAMSLISVAPLMVLIGLASILVMLALSLIFALPLLKSWLGSGGAANTLSGLSAKVAPYKMILGVICLGLAAYTLIRMVV